MKLRVGGNSIRLRVLRSEVAALREGKPLQETLYLGPGEDARLTYALHCDPTADRIAVDFKGHAIRVHLPATRVQLWADGAEVGMYDALDAGDGRTLEVLVEKDFACLDRSDADNRDTFDNPNLTC